MDFAAAGLLDGLEGNERAAREHLLERLTADGFSLEQLQEAVADDRLALLPAARVLGGRYTASEIEQRSGLPAALMLRIRRLLGLPEPTADDRVFRDEDIAAARSIRLFVEAGFSEDALAEITRVMGEGMARLAATITATFTDSFLEPGDSEEDVAFRFASLTDRLTPAVQPVLTAAFEAQLYDAVSRGVIGQTERETGRFVGSQQVAICFSDLVGFTRLGGEVEADELGSVVGRFAELAAEVAEPPARLVKTIGDGAMFVSSEPAGLVGIALTLVETVEAADLPAVRAGIAYGPALVQAGDYYGHTVNVASRVTGIARPGSVLCTQDVRDAAPDDFEWSYAGRHRLKGIAEAVPLDRARRLTEGGGEPAGDSRNRGRSTRRRADRRRRQASS